MRQNIHGNIASTGRNGRKKNDSLTGVTKTIATNLAMTFARNDTFARNRLRSKARINTCCINGNDASMESHASKQNVACDDASDAIGRRLIKTQAYHRNIDCDESFTICFTLPGRTLLSHLLKVMQRLHASYALLVAILVRDRLHQTCNIRCKQYYQRSPKNPNNQKNTNTCAS